MSKKSLRDEVFSHNVFDEWLQKNPLPDRFKGSDFEPLPVRQPEDKPSVTGMLEAFDDGADIDEIDRPPTPWGRIIGTAVFLWVMIAALVVHFARG